ncbi:probable 30S ribosomal protein S11 at C-terminar half [Coccomyxa sp. Obi]|nr:probable 30S ribosomal protein S11 at C-terminar half [Coccomyxa sp. Obi]
MLARFSRATGRQLLQFLEDTCVRTTSRECNSVVQGRMSMCKLHSGRSLSGIAGGTDPPAATDIAASSSSTDSGAAQTVQDTYSSTSTSAAPRAHAVNEGADAAVSEGAIAQQPPTQQQAVFFAGGGTSAPQEQRSPLSARLGSAGEEQRRPFPPRRGPSSFEQPPPAQEYGFQGRSRQLVNLKQRQVGVMSVLSTTNNTIITLSDTEGRVQAWASGGTLGFTNARKSTTHAAEAVAAHMGEKARTLGFTTVTIRVKGMGYGKQKAVRILHSSGLRVTSIEECTPAPHNGCRLPRKRRT